LYNGVSVLNIAEGDFRVIKFDPSLPFMYLTDSDFTSFATNFAKEMNTAKCHTDDPGYCKWDTPCSDFPTVD